MSLAPPTLSISRVTPREERKPTLQYPAEHSLAPSTGGGQAECAVVAAAWSAPSSPQLIRASPTSPTSSSDVPVAAEGRDAADGRGTRPLQLDGLPQGRRPQPLSTSCSRMCTGGMGGRSWRTAGTPSCRRRSLRCRRSSLASIRPAQSGASRGRAVGCAVSFRPCIDIDKGKVKQIVGSTLRDASNDGMTRVTKVSIRICKYLQRRWTGWWACHNAWRRPCKLLCCPGSTPLPASPPVQEPYHKWCLLPRTVAVLAVGVRLPSKRG
ncbi:uncharacterized protein [Triticum aestivum]|uniref:uncharacterized protein n=1 Tax=Triticum aestivum TaxID=4565 RepID=UPI001D017B0B|nr:uncharacterized protein LOC123160288 [Triticum aestivum]XP_044434027.1 uncharacterized protein LOC123160288 [Triticum aestivum]XP_044434028.1 uncharacterized protein LOC123160288 [Triticum aestivum]